MYHKYLGEPQEYICPIFAEQSFSLKFECFGVKTLSFNHLKYFR